MDSKKEIVCPKCKEGKLIQSNDIVLLSYPPQIHVTCDKCKFETTIEYKQ